MHQQRYVLAARRSAALRRGRKCRDGRRASGRVWSRHELPVAADHHQGPVARRCRQRAVRDRRPGQRELPLRVRRHRSAAARRRHADHARPDRRRHEPAHRRTRHPRHSRARHALRLRLRPRPARAHRSPEGRRRGRARKGLRARHTADLLGADRRQHGFRRRAHDGVLTEHRGRLPRGAHVLRRRPRRAHTPCDGVRGRTRRESAHDRARRGLRHPPARRALRAPRGARLRELPRAAHEPAVGVRDHEPSERRDHRPRGVAARAPIRADARRRCLVLRRRRRPHPDHVGPRDRTALPLRPRHHVCADEPRQRR